MRILPLFLILLTACTAKAYKQPVSEERLLFVLHAETASMDFAEGTTISGRLHFEGVNDSVVFFSERPNRRAGNIPMERFLQEWNRGERSFELQPPNAGFIFFEPSNSPESRSAHYSEINLTLRNPHYDKKKETLSFDVTLLSPAKRIPDGILLEPTLFIDSASRENYR